VSFNQLELEILPLQIPFRNQFIITEGQGGSDRYNEDLTPNQVLPPRLTYNKEIFSIHRKYKENITHRAEHNFSPMDDSIFRPIQTSINSKPDQDMVNPNTNSQEKEINKNLRKGDIAKITRGIAPFIKANISFQLIIDILLCSRLYLNSDELLKYLWQSFNGSSKKKQAKVNTHGGLYEIIGNAELQNTDENKIKDVDARKKLILRKAAWKVFQYFFNWFYEEWVRSMTYEGKDDEKKCLFKSETKTSRKVQKS